MNAPDRMVVDLAERLFADHTDALGCVPDEPLNRGLWTALVASDLLTLMAPGDLHGLPEACEVAREVGRTAARAPVIESLVAAWAYAQCGWGRPAWEQGLATYAFAAVGLASPTLVSAAYGAEAREVVVFADDMAFQFETAGAAPLPGANLAGEPRAVLAFDASRVRRSAPLPSAQARALAAVLRTAAMAGAAQRALAIALEHARTRVQFGRPIGTFQAVQQMLAQLAGQVALLSAAADSAATGFAMRGDPLLAAAAKAAAGEAVVPVTEAAHQVVAAIGYTREHDLHRYTRRLWSWRDEDGTEMEWQELLGRRLLASDGTLWQFVTAVMTGK